MGDIERINKEISRIIKEKEIVFVTATQPSRPNDGFTPMVRRPLGELDIVIVDYVNLIKE